MSRIPGTSYQFEPVAVKAAVPYIYFSLWGEEKSRSVVTGTHSLLMAIHGESERTLIEKTPRNVFILDRLARWYEQAKFIGLIRDGRDVAASWLERPWFVPAGRWRRHEPGGYRYGPEPHFWVESDRIAEFESTTTGHRCMWGWRAHTEAWLESTDVIPAERRLEIRYEELVTEPAKILPQISTLLQLNERAAASLDLALARADPRSLGRGKDTIGADQTAMAEGEPLLESLGYL